MRFTFIILNFVAFIAFNVFYALVKQWLAIIGSEVPFNLFVWYIVVNLTFIAIFIVNIVNKYD